MDECWLEEIAARQGIGAAIFTPFVVLRPQGETWATEATLTVEMRDIPQTTEAQTVLRLQ